MLDAGSLESLNLTILPADRIGFSPLTQVTLGLSGEVAVDPTLDRHAADGAMQSTLHASGGLLLETPHAMLVLDDLTLGTVQDSPGVRWLVTHGPERLPVFEFAAAKFALDVKRGSLVMESGDLTISPALAKSIGRPQFAGASIGSLAVRVAFLGDQPVDVGLGTEYENAEAASLASDDSRGGSGGTNCFNPGEADIGPDVIVGDLMDLTNYNSSGGIEAFAVGTYSCNIGSQDLLWVENNNQHPVIGQSMFRLKSGRFEHIGQSWLKHGFLALDDDICGCGCTGPGGAQLDVGCADPYCCGLNGQQGNLGPKYQVNPFTGFYTYPPANPGFGGSIARRLQVSISDLDPAMSGGGQYFVEGQYVTADDAFWGNHANNASYRPVNITGGGSAWSAALTSFTHRESPAIRAWQDTDPGVTETNVAIPGEAHAPGQLPRSGLVIVSSKATDVGGGVWQYEYAVQNVNSERSVRTFSVPLNLNTDVQMTGFHDVSYHSGEPFDGTNWTPTIAANAITWSTSTFGDNPNANAIRWGTLFNFRFEADKPPVTTTATLGLFKTGTPGSPSITQGSIVGPGGEPDCNGNLIADACDLDCGVPAGACDVPGCGGSMDCDTNAVPDDCQPDCNVNGAADPCDLDGGGSGTLGVHSQDCNSNDVPDECESPSPVPLATVRVASGLSDPVFVTAPANDFARLFIVEQTGRIKILTGGSVLATNFLNISGLISTGGERGLLGMAFHPSYASNGFFYVNYTNTSGHTVIARYTVSGGDPNVANAGSALILKTINQPFANHNGGCLQFGPDQMMYVGMGDGGSANDPLGNGQNTGTLLGKMLRLDVDAAAPYVPTDNPFVGPGNPLDEIWAIGMRNPWRFSFDRLKGDMYIADVGQGAWEEIDFQPASSTGGENYGWRCMEGNSCTGLSGCVCNDPGLTDPIAEYSHGAGCSITGGYVYRGCAIPSLSGTYFYADFCSNFVRTFEYDGVTVTNAQDRTAELDPPAGQGNLTSISSFGEDAAGELYIVSLEGNVYKIVPDVVTPVCGNGIVELGEECDDNNTLAGDGCDGSCQIEAGTDVCLDAAPVCPGTQLGSTQVATSDGSSSCGNSDGSPDVWYQYTPDSNGVLIASTCLAANFDTVISIHTSCPGSSGNEVGCDDNGCAVSRSQASIPVTLGVTYYIRVAGAGGASGDYTLSISGPNCMECPVLLFEDRFDTDQGWTVLNENLTDGAWSRGVPVGDGTRGDPTDDYDGGGAAQLTDNTGGNSDVDGGPTRLLSPVIDLSAAVTGGSPVTLSYAYWLARDDAEGTDHLLAEVSTNGGTNWTPIAEYSDGQEAWFVETVTLDDLVTPTATMRFRFSVSDLPNNSIVEAGIDAVLLSTPCPGDCNANGIPDATDISQGFSEDCQGNGRPDECDIADGTSSDCDGGPVGSIDGGQAIVSVSCFGCHDADGSGGQGFPGPNIRNKSRVEIWNRVRPPTNHPGGSHPEFDQQDYADLEAFLADGGSRGRPDEIPDECQNSRVLSDCDGDTTADGCELESGTQIDANYDGLPDQCSPPTCNAVSAVALGQRYLSISAAAGTGRLALNVIGDAGDPPVACIDLYVQSDGTLAATPVLQTAAAWGTKVLSGEIIRPGTGYTAEAECSFGNSAPQLVTTADWGDLDSDGDVDVDDISCVLGGFSGDFAQCSFEQVDIGPCVPNSVIDVDDILDLLDAFAGLAYPCAGPCP